MNLDELLARLSRLPNLPADLHAAVEEHQRQRADALWRQRRFAYVGPTRDRYLVNNMTWRTDSVGASALAHAVRNPGKWVGLPRGTRSLRAWNAAINHAVSEIDKADIGLAEALRPRRERGPGTHLRSAVDERGPLVEIMWRPGAFEVACSG